MDDLGTSALVTGKSPKYLRNAAVLLIGSMLLLGTVLTVVERQLLQTAEDFNSNDNVHFIEVSAPVAGGAESARLTFADVSTIRHTVEDVAPGGHSVTTLLQTGFGIPDADGAEHFLTGLDGDDARLVGREHLRDGTAYSTSADRDEVELQVPVVEVTDGGMTSQTVSRLPLRAEDGLSPDSPLFVLTHADEASTFVSGETFRTVLSHAFGRPWAEIERGYEADNPFGIPIIGAVYVRVHDLDEVASVAAALERDGYLTDYTFKAFDDLAASLDSTFLLGVLTVALVAALGMGLSLANINTYFRLAHRDMGVLRHIGYPTRAVSRIYGRRVARISGRAAVAVGAVVVTLGATLLPSASVAYAALNVALVLGSILLVHLIASRVLLQRHVRLDVLSLLKVGREFD